MHYIMSCYSFAMQVTAERSGYHRSVIRKSLMPFIFIIYCIALPRNYISNPLFFCTKTGGPLARYYSCCLGWLLWGHSCT